MIKRRTFPRYYVSPLRMRGILSHHPEASFQVVDASLSGLKVRSETPIEIPLHSPMVLEVSKQTYKVFVQQAWEHRSPEGDVAYYGLHILFEERELFNSWLNFIKALHLLRLKQQQKKKKPY